MASASDRIAPSNLQAEQNALAALMKATEVAQQVKTLQSCSTLTPPYVPPHCRHLQRYATIIYVPTNHIPLTISFYQAARQFMVAQTQMAESLHTWAAAVPDAAVSTYPTLHKPVFDMWSQCQSE